MTIVYNSPTTFDINYDPAHIIKQQRSALYAKYQDERNATFKVHGVSRETFTVMSRHRKTMRAMRQSIETIQKRYIRCQLNKLRARRDQLEDFADRYHWGLQVGDILSTLNWSEQNRQELGELYDLIDRLDIPKAYLFDDDQPEWLK